MMKDLFRVIFSGPTTIILTLLVIATILLIIFTDVFNFAQ